MDKKVFLRKFKPVLSLFDSNRFFVFSIPGIKNTVKTGFYKNPLVLSALARCHQSVSGSFRFFDSELLKFVSPVTDKLMKTGLKNYLTYLFGAGNDGFRFGKIQTTGLTTWKHHKGTERCLSNMQPLFLCRRILGLHTDGVLSHWPSFVSQVVNISVWAVFVFDKAKADLWKNNHKGGSS